MTEYWIDHFNRAGAPFNYIRGTRITRVAYQGLHDLKTLLSGCAAEKTYVGKVSNAAVVGLAAPLAFERHTQVFDLTARRFPFGRDLKAPYRIPFFFVEDGVVKLYFLQPRKGAALSFDDFCMVGTIAKKYLLDDEFFGQRYDIEFVDVAADEGEARSVRKYSLNDLNLWSDRKLTDRLTLVSESLDAAVKSGRIEERRRIFQRQAPDMPLFG